MKANNGVRRDQLLSHVAVLAAVREIGRNAREQFLVKRRSGWREILAQMPSAESNPRFPPSSPSIPGGGQRPSIPLRLSDSLQYTRPPNLSHGYGPDCVGRRFPGYNSRSLRGGEAFRACLRRVIARRRFCPPPYRCSLMRNL